MKNNCIFIKNTVSLIHIQTKKEFNLKRNLFLTNNVLLTNEVDLLILFLSSKVFEVSKIELLAISQLDHLYEGILIYNIRCIFQKIL